MLSLLTVLSITAFTTVNRANAAPALSNNANHSRIILKMKAGYMNLPGKKSHVSDLSITNFNKDFSNVKNVMWERKGDFDVATFTKDNTQVKAFFGMQSELIGTITNKTYADLPAEGRKEINDQYPGYAIGQVIYFKTYTPNDNFMVLYGTQIENANSYYVELSKGNDKIVVRVDPLGSVSYFSKMT